MEIISSQSLFMVRDMKLSAGRGGGIRKRSLGFFYFARYFRLTSFLFSTGSFI